MPVSICDLLGVPYRLFAHTLKSSRLQMKWQYSTTISVGAEVLRLIYQYQENIKARIIHIEGHLSKVSTIFKVL